MKRVLITGATGFIGRHSLPLLLEKCYEVHAVFNTRKPVYSKNSNLFWHPCNLLKLEDQKVLIDEVRPTHLLHLAWSTTPGRYWHSSDNLRWVQATIELLMNFIKVDGQRIVVAGTSAEYDWSCGCCSEQNTPCHPSTLYGNCKNSMHNILNSFSKQTGLSYAWGRVFFLYGPMEYQERLVPSIIGSLIKNKETICLNGNLIRDFLYVEDAASSFVSLLESNVTGPVNIASGNPIAIKEVVYTIADKLGKQKLLQFKNNEPTLKEPTLVYAEVDRLKHEIGWLPAYDLNCGLEHTINWWKENSKNDY